MSTEYRPTEKTPVQRYVKELYACRKNKVAVCERPKCVGK